MAHFYGTVQGHRGEATRTGTKSSGLSSSACGWNIGGEVTVTYNSQLDTDVVSLYRNNGSNGRGSTLVASFAIIDNQLQLLQTNYPEILI